MPVLVMKFGGTSVASLDEIKNAAKRVASEVSAGHSVIVIVSAMAGKTNELVQWANETSPLHDAREYDAIVSSGENVTAGLMALTLQEMDIPARSWQGWQVPVKTSSAHSSARIEEMTTGNMVKNVNEGKRVAIVAGFQGSSETGRVTTLGRGGSDTTAVAFAAAFEATRCDIYTDVDGIYTTDQRVVPEAKKIKSINFEEMLEMASLGSKVLQTRSVEFAGKYKVKLRVLSSFSPNNEGTEINFEEKKNMEDPIISGIAFNRDEAEVNILGVPDMPGIAYQILGPIAEAKIDVDVIIQNLGQDGLTDFTFTVQKNDLKKTLKILNEKVKDHIKAREVKGDDKIAKLSIIGVGMRSHVGVASKMFRTLAEEGVNISTISTSEIKISVILEEKSLDKAVNALHKAFDLDKI